MSELEELHAQAVVARVAAFFAKTYEPGTIPSPPSYPIISVTVDQGIAAHRRLNAGTGVRRWRAVVQYVGATEAATRLAASRQRQALETHRLLIAGFKTGPCIVESSQPIGKEGDDERSDDAQQLFVGNTVWTFPSIATTA